MFDSIDPNHVFPLLVSMAGMSVGLIIAVVAIVAGMVTARAREATKREIAAYVASGSIDGKTALALIQSKVDSDALISIKAAARTVETPVPAGA
jgi:hypothetical protein